MSKRVSNKKGSHQGARCRRVRVGWRTRRAANPVPAPMASFSDVVKSVVETGAISKVLSKFKLPRFSSRKGQA